MKFVIAILIAALLVVFGLIFVVNFMPSTPAAPAAAPTAQPTASPVPTEAPAQTAEPEAELEAVPLQTEAEPDDGEIYEGALAGLTEEEIGAMAMSEEGAHLPDVDMETGVD